MTEYLIMNRISKDQCWSTAASFEGACRNLGWMVADCYQVMAKNIKGRKEASKNGRRERK
jgi:hypothetical protein